LPFVIQFRMFKFWISALWMLLCWWYHMAMIKRLVINIVQAVYKIPYHYEWSRKEQSYIKWDHGMRDLLIVLVCLDILLC
jgi:hypothetical protein